MLQELVNVKSDEETIDNIQPVESKADELGSPSQETPAPAAEGTEEAKNPETVPLPVYMDLKHELRDTKKGYETLSQEIQLLKAQTSNAFSPAAPMATPAPAAEPDPLESYIQEYQRQYKADNGTPIRAEDVPLPAVIITRREEWKARQADAQRQHDLQVQRADELNKARVTYTDANVGQGLGFDTIVGIGQGYLTEGDMVDINNSPTYAETMYDRCISRLINSGTAQGSIIAERVAARQAAIAAPATPVSPATPAAPAPSVSSSATEVKTTEEAPAMEDIFRPTMNAIGLAYPS